MKKFLANIGVAALLATVFVFNVSAQVPTWANNIIPLPAIPANTASNLASPVYVNYSKQQNGGFQLLSYETSALLTTGTNGYVLYTLSPAVDQANPDTNRTIVISLTQRAGIGTTNGSGVVTNFAIFSTNLPVAGYSGYFVTRIENDATNGPLVTSISAPVKISAP